MQVPYKPHRAVLESIARKAMLEKGLLPDIPSAAMEELSMIKVPIITDMGQYRDLRNLPWVSIDNDDSRDLDQLTVADVISGDAVKILVAVADVDGIVKIGSAIDQYARHNTTSVYTAARIFPMLPEKLSNNLTSLNYDEDRPAIVVEMFVNTDGSLKGSDVYRAIVHNKAKLSYRNVAAWLEGEGATPDAVKSITGLDENLRKQDRIAHLMGNFRHLHGALSFETTETKPIFAGDEVRDLEEEKKDRATDIIENFMIAANSVASRFIAERKLPCLLRVVQTPKRWERIVEIADEHGFILPNEPDSKALEDFLLSYKARDPLGFPDLSRSIIKLLGPGTYVAEMPDNPSPPGHFSLAVRSYAHSTAPNRRYADLVTQRLIKAAIAESSSPYGKEELEALAKHCTEAEDAANKVERQVGKSAAAILLESRIGERFDAIVTGAAAKGTWVRLFNPPVEGKLVRGIEGLDVGHKLRVQLIHTDVENGFIDFKRVN
jgi:VacB/RNase II family 3'-5' exoribonuclease